MPSLVPTSRDRHHKLFRLALIFCFLIGLVACAQKSAPEASTSAAAPPPPPPPPVIAAEPPSPPVMARPAPQPVPVAGPTAHAKPPVPGRETAAMSGGIVDMAAMTIPQFDWPPPKASAQEVIPDKWLRTGEAPTLADVADKFEKALKLAGYKQRSYYSVPEGFALATQLEHIKADGTPLPGDDRWTVGTPRVGNLSLLAFIKALARAPAGVYRAIVFVVTDAPWVQTTAAPSDDKIMGWAGSGANALPTSIGDLPYTRNYRATALIYEFRKGKTGPAETVLPSTVSGETHLDKGGLWDPLSIL